MSESKAKKIRDILIKCCPALDVTGKGPAVWHQCSCRANPLHTDCHSPCTCIWRLTDTCLAGTWPQLSFLRKVAAKESKAAQKWFKKAEAAIAEAKKQEEKPALPDIEVKK